MHDTRTVKVKQEEETDTRIKREKVVGNLKEKNVGVKGKSPWYPRGLGSLANPR